MVSQLVYWYHHLVMTERIINNFNNYLDTGDYRLSPEVTKSQVECFRTLFSPLGPDSILCDIACGDGRHTFPLAEHFRGVVGLDVSLPLLEKGIRTIDETDTKNVSFIAGDMRKIGIKDNSFDGVLNGFSSWGFFGPEGDTQSIKEMARILKPGGVLVFDYGNVLSRLRDIEERGVYNNRLGRKVTTDFFEETRVTRINWVDDDLIYHWVCLRGDEGSSSSIIEGQQQGYTPHQVIDIFSKAGLTPAAPHHLPHTDGTYGSYEFDPIKDQERRIIIRAIKQ